MGGGGGLYHLNTMFDSRTTSGHESDHTNTKSVDNKFHSVLDSDMLNNQSNNSFSSFESKSEVDVNLCKLPHKSITVCNFNAYIDALMYDNFDIDVYPDANHVSVMLQQAVQCPQWRGWLKGTSLQAHLTSSNHGGGLKNTNIDTNSYMKYDSNSVGSVQPGFKNDESNTVSHQANSYTDGVDTSLCRVDFTQYQC